MVTEVDKVLIEQTLFGMNDEPLHGEEYLIEAFDQYIDNPCPSYDMDDVLRESIETSYLYSKYVPLMEAVSQIKNAEKELTKLESEKDETKKTNFFAKSAESVKKVINWYYKVDPETQANNFRLVMKIVSKIVSFALRWKLFGAKSMFTLTDPELKPGDASNLRKKINIFKDKLKASEIDISKNAKVDIKTPFKNKVKGKDGTTEKHNIVLRLNICVIILNLLSTALQKLDAEFYYRINVKDIDDNIKKYDNMVKMFDEAIDEETDQEIIASLEKGKQKTINALRDLFYIREEKEKRESKEK